MPRLTDGQRVERIATCLEHAAFDPSEWNLACDELAGIVDASGGVLVPYDSGQRGFLQPRSSSLEAVFQAHIASGWSRRDFRVRGFPKSLSAGYVTDQDLITPEEMARHPYYAEFLAPFDLKWFAAISFRVNGKLWACSIEGSPQRGPFLSGDIDKLIRMREPLAVAARRAALLGHQRVESLEKAFVLVERGVAALGWAGNVLWLNARAEELLKGGSIRGTGHLASSDVALDARLQNLLDGALAYRPTLGFTPPGPVLASFPGGRTLSIDAVPVPRDFKALLSGISAIVTFHEVADATAVNDNIRERFRLTGRESELAAHLAAGKDVGRAAVSMDISVATARQHLKAIFGKTGVRRQAELVALLARRSR